MRKIINKQVHQVVILNHPVVMKNGIRKSIKFDFNHSINILISVVLARIPHHQTIIEMVLIVIIHQTKKNRNYLQYYLDYIRIISNHLVIDMINHPLQAVIVDRIHHVVPNEMMHDDDQGNFFYFEFIEAFIFTI